MSISTNTSHTQNNGGNTFFYGWIALLACMLIQAIPYGIGANIQPQFINFVVKGEGFTLTQFSLIFTISSIASAIASPFIGLVLSNRKYPFKLIYLIGALLSGGGFMAFAFAKGIWLFYIIAAIVQLGNATISAIGVPLIINSWFEKNKGMAMGIAFSGGGIGNIFLQKITATLLSTKGYRFSYFVFGMISLAVSIPITIFLMRLPKSKSELAAYVPKKKKEEKKEVVHWGYTISEVMKLSSFWVFSIGFVFVGLYVSSMAVQFMGYFYDIGLSASFVGTAGSVFAFFSIIGNLFGGVLFDKMGIKNTLFLAGTLTVISGLSLIFLKHGTWLGLVFAVTYGISIYAYIVGPSYLSSVLFGNREYAKILGVVQLFFAAGFAAGSSLFGVIVDYFNGSYIPAWIIATIYVVIAYIMLIAGTLLITKRNKQNNVWVTKRIE